MPDFATTPSPWPAAALDRLRDAALGSTRMGPSPLTGTFVASRGFAATVTGAPGSPRHRESRRALRASDVAFLEPFVDHVIRGPGSKLIFSPWERLIQRVGAGPCNAFYVNLLWIPPGEGIGNHVDATLAEPLGFPGPPRLVSVLYLQVPPGDGGHLRIFPEGRPAVEIPPRTGALVHFRGELPHEVAPVAPQDEGPPAGRASLVCEQYAVPNGELGRLPPFSLTSPRRRFADVLASRSLTEGEGEGGKLP